MSDDWRLRVDLREEGLAHRLTEWLNAAELEHDLEASFEDRVIVSVEGAELFCYAGNREQAELAEKLIRSEAVKRGWNLECELGHWHPAAEAWEDPDKPLPDSDAERAAERARLMERERLDSREQGFADFEVRVQCRSHSDVLELANKLREEGLPNVHRWRFLVIGAPDEDSAKALAERVRAQAPDGSTVTVEASAQVVLAERPSNPFAIFGGLAG